jgi:hypothetical protein
MCSTRPDFPLLKMTDSIADSCRRQILLAIKQSIDDINYSAEEIQFRFLSSALMLDSVEWVMQCGKEALKDLVYLHNHSDIDLTSSDIECLDIIHYRLRQESEDGSIWLSFPQQ